MISQDQEGLSKSISAISVGWRRLRARAAARPRIRAEVCRRSRLEREHERTLALISDKAAGWKTYLSAMAARAFLRRSPLAAVRNVRARNSP
jgi:hypothetical protein